MHDERFCRKLQRFQINVICTDPIVCFIFDLLISFNFFFIYKNRIIMVSGGYKYVEKRRVTIFYHLFIYHSFIFTVLSDQSLFEFFI
jgi:hypothetical protein